VAAAAVGNSLEQPGIDPKSFQGLQRLCSVLDTGTTRYR
jgi:hypothetical protein